MRVLLVASALVVAAAVAPPAGGGRQGDLLVRHGQSIGKVKLGMTLPQVRALLGRERAVNKREKRGTRGYIYLELDWDYAWWTVGFMRAPGGKFRAVSIGTVQRSQRTPQQLGVGSTDVELAHKLDVRCRIVYPAVGGTAFQSECVYGPSGRPQTIFVLDKWRGVDEEARVSSIEVRDPLFYRGWRVKLCPLRGRC